MENPTSVHSLHFYDAPRTLDPFIASLVTVGQKTQSTIPFSGLMRIMKAGHQIDNPQTFIVAIHSLSTEGRCSFWSSRGVADIWYFTGVIVGSDAAKNVRGSIRLSSGNGELCYDL